MEVQIRGFQPSRRLDVEPENPTAVGMAVDFRFSDKCYIAPRIPSSARDSDRPTRKHDPWRSDSRTSTQASFRLEDSLLTSATISPPLVIESDARSWTTDSDPFGNRECHTFHHARKLPMGLKSTEIHEIM